MEERKKYNRHFVHIAGLACILAGITALGTVFYVLIVLNSLGLTLDMFEETESLLTWIAENKLSYSLLWFQHGAAAVLMLPVPLATSQLFRNRSSRSSSLAMAAYLIGLCGFYLLIISAILFFAVSPLTATAFLQGTEQMVLFHEIFVALGMQFRLFGEFLIGLWLFGIGIHLVRKNKIDSMGWYFVILFVITTVIAFGKAFDIFDWEPFLGMILAITYIWLGKTLRDKTK